jgi:hypothetical protein
VTGWKPLDTRKVLDRARKQQEATTTANVGGFVGPAFVPVQRPPVTPPKRKKKDRP